MRPRSDQTAAPSGFRRTWLGRGVEPATGALPRSGLISTSEAGQGCAYRKFGSCVLVSSPVHSAHVGQALEVHYRFHPYCGSKVLVRRVEQRTTGLFLQVQAPTGVVISIAGWMLDPVVCAGMVIRAPRVDVAALVEPQRWLKGAVKAADSRSDVAIVSEENNAVSRDAVGGKGSADEFVIGR